MMIKFNIASAYNMFDLCQVQLFGASLSEPRIHERQEAVLYIYVCGVIISVKRELNFERVR